MRFAVIADIHGNLVALEAVLDQLAAEEPDIDRIVCAGNLVGHGTQPNEVIGLLRERQVESVLGNYDDAVAHARVGAGVDFADRASEVADAQAIARTRQTLNADNLAYLQGLPRDVRLFPFGSRVGVKRDEVRGRDHEYGRSLWVRALVGGLFMSGRGRPSRVRRVLVVHASPRALNERVPPDVANSILATISKASDADVLISAHSGESYQRQREGVMLIGVGPVSGPGAVPHLAQYAVVSVEEDIEVRFGVAPY